MQGWVNYVRGWVRLTVCGSFPERFLNLCAQRSMTFWAVEWLDGHSLRVTLLRRDMGSVEELAQRAGCSWRVERREGLPSFLGRFRRRYTFLVGLALSVLSVCLLSNFVLTIDVTGNERVPDAVILSQLRRQGLHPGVYGPGLDTKQLSVDAQLALRELAWVSINLHGTRAQVVVREKVAPPTLLEEKEVRDLVAGAGGLILRVEAVQGQAKVKAGDTVAPGEMLISGTVTMEGPQYSDVPARYLYVRADGAVWARTWRTVRASIPIMTTVKKYTGAEKNRWILTVFDKCINFYRNSSISWPDYDKISKTYPAILPSGQTLPLSLTRQTLRRWQPVQVQIDTTAAQELLERQLSARLEELTGEDGSVITVDWSARIDQGVLTVTGTAECEEQIARPANLRKNDGEPSAG